MLLFAILFLVIFAVSYKWLYRAVFQLVSTKNPNASKNKLSNVHELFLKTAFTLLGYVAKSDGAVNTKEIAYTEIFMEKMNLDQNHKREAIRFFKIGSDPKFNAKKTIDKFKILAKKSPSLTQTLLAYLVSLARTDGLLADEEVYAVQNVALGLGYSTTAFNNLLKMSAPQNNKENSHSNAEPYQTPHQNGVNTHLTENGSLAAAYKIFKVQKSASNTEIKKAYRQLASKYHPDKLIGHGLQSNKLKASSENFIAIQAAYDDIKKSRT